MIRRSTARFSRRRIVPYRADRFGTRGDTVAFTTCLILSLIALALPEGLRAPIAAWLRGTVLMPALTVQEQQVRGAAYRRSVHH